MKKLLIILFIALCGIQFSWAIKAISTPVKKTQRDGTTITIRIHGDEFSHYTSTLDGYQIVSRDGIYYYYETSIVSKSGVSLVRASDPDKRSGSERSLLASRAKGRLDGLPAATDRMLSYSTHALRASKSKASVDVILPTTGIVVLVQFQDVRFQSGHTVETFSKMLNQKGYSFNGATGSARDYYVDNSQGKYVPQFDISPIVTLPNDMDFYGENSSDTDSDVNPNLMVVEACQLASAAGVDFSQYDHDEDGVLDNVFIYFAGHNEAEGADESAIWPHRWVVRNYPNTYVNGVKVWDYACGSELKGAEGSTLCGIGTFCHEFGHVLGLPDFYDTDGAIGGNSGGLYHISVMSAGNYNNGGNTPPHYNALERALLGWLDLIELNGAETITLDPIHISNQGYYIRSQNSPAEIFVIEARKNESWDRPLSNSGMLIYHIDQSENNAIGMTAENRWQINRVNSNVGHECVKFIESSGRKLAASEQSNPNSYNKVFYPGLTNNTAFNKSSYGGRDWMGNAVPIELLEIRNSNGTVSFKTKSEAQGDSNFEIVLSQRSALITVIANEICDSYSVLYKAMNGSLWSEVVIDNSEKTAQISDLEPMTEYEFQLYAVVGTDRRVLSSLELSTKELSAPFAAIANIKPSFLVGQTLELSLTNTPSMPRSVMFLMDDALYEDKIIFTVAGKFTLKAVVTYGDGTKEVITRKITVK